MLLDPFYYISHFYPISLSSDEPYRSTLTIPAVACIQTHILRSTILPPKTHQMVIQYCATWSTLLHCTLLPHLTIFRPTLSVNIDHTICSMPTDSYSPTDHSTAENTSNRYIIMCYSIHSTIFHTSTPSHYLPTNPIGQHWPYHM